MIRPAPSTPSTTIVNESGVLHAYNTDYQAVADLLRDNNVDTSLSVAVAGSGGMAKAVVAAVRGHRIHRRHRDRPQPASGGHRFAKQYGFDWQAELGELRPGVLINATPIGMSGGAEADALSFPEQRSARSRCRLRRRRDACEDATDRCWRPNSAKRRSQERRSLPFRPPSSSFSTPVCARARSRSSERRNTHGRRNHVAVNETGETPPQQLARNFNELLQELRVALSGVQILFCLPAGRGIHRTLRGERRRTSAASTW